MGLFKTMFGNLATKLFGTRNDRILTKLQPTVDAINALEETISALSDADLQAKTNEFITTPITMASYGIFEDARRKGLI